MVKPRKGMSIGLVAEWEKQPGVCRLCKSCEDEIFGSAFVLVLKIAGRKESTDTVLCEPCYNEMNNEAI